MKLRSLTQDSRKISLGQALRLVAEMNSEILESESLELLILRDLQTGEYWSLEEDRIQIHLLKELAKLVSGVVELNQLREIPAKVYPDLRAGKVNKNSRKQAVVFLCRQRSDYSQRIPSLDARDFWRELENAFSP